MEQSEIKVGIIGYGVIGSTFGRWLSEHTACQVAVTYFNGIYELCHNMNADYEHVRQGFLLSGYLSPTHTHVPGPDGKTGYGGKCFPKDVNAFATYTQNMHLGQLLKQVAEQNEYYRQK